MRGMGLLRSRHFKKLRFDHSVHLAHSEEDAAGELLLVVDGEPAGEHGLDLRLQDLRAGQLRQRLLLQDAKVLLRARLGSELVAVAGGRRVFTEHIHRTLHSSCICK